MTICQLSEFSFSYFNEGFFPRGSDLLRIFFSFKASLEMQVINHLTPKSN